VKDTQDLSAQLTKVREHVLTWEDRLASRGEDATAFRQAVGELRAALEAVGRSGFQRLAQACEVADATLVSAGQVYRYKQEVAKEWMTLWGKVVVSRRLYQLDRGGPSWVPLDERCGMVGRFMVPELERVSAILGAQRVPAEVEASLAQILPEAPSRTAIQHVLARVGHSAEAGADQLELTLESAAPLEVAGDTLVTSWDGVTVPLREAAPKRGRPAERPMPSDRASAPTAWKEAGVGMVATYQAPLDPATEAPRRIDVRSLARMPEVKMATLITGLVDQTERAVQRGRFPHRVVLADGKREIWRVVAEHAVFDDFTRILDFYHAAQHLSLAAEYLFGKSSTQADGWFRKWRHQLAHEPNAVRGLIRSVTYHRRKLSRRSQRYRLAGVELGYLRHNRDKMDYAGYRAAGLIISSGPVEAAAKTIVGHRLKRSGMRWTRPGGQQILNLRALVQSGRWDPFWNWYLQRTTNARRHAAQIRGYTRSYSSSATYRSTAS
jgi:hypothetical protein